MRLKAIAAYLDALSRSDGVAVGYTLGFVGLLAGFAVFAWVIKRNNDADDRRRAERRKKRGY